MERRRDGRLLAERAIGSDAAAGGAASARPARSVTVNLAESPLGWLVSRGLVSQRQYDAGERLRSDWEQAQLAPRVTMAWDSAPIARGRGSAATMPDPRGAQIDARRRFDWAIDHAGPGLADILWRIVCAGDGMREAESALGWPARAGKLVLTIALDRIADHYRIPLGRTHEKRRAPGLGTRRNFSHSSGAYSPSSGGLSVEPLISLSD